VWILRGDCTIRQGTTTARASEMVLWINRAEPTPRDRHRVTAYLEGDVSVEHAVDDRPARVKDRHWLGTFRSGTGLHVQARQVAGRPDVLPAVYQRAMDARRPPAEGSLRRTPVRAAQYAETIPTPAPYQLPSPSGSLPDASAGSLPGSSQPPLVPVEEPAGTAGARRVRVFPRGDLPVQAQWFPSPNTDDWVAVIDSGVNLIVDGLTDFGSVDVSADRVVIWTRGGQEPDLTGQTMQDDRLPLEVYMEGNIVFRQGQRVIHAERMYYDVMRRRGTVLRGELLTPVPNYQGLLRLKADVIQQAGEGRFFARDGFVTSSRMGRPGYRIQSGDIEFEDLQFPQVNPFTGAPVIDPATGEQVIGHRQRATARSNALYLGPVPVFYWPVLSTNLEDPTFYIRSANIRQDRVYGTQLLTTWNMYELLGWETRPAGTDWDLSLDYLGDRGFGHGTTFTYRREDFFGFPGDLGGLADFWGIHDQGLDNLGDGRRNIPPEKDYRYRLFWQHRHELPADLQLSLETGWISDRNFLEQFFENEWDTLKDQSTGAELKRLAGNRSWSVSADIQLNEFFTETEWLPRGDHFWLGESVFDTFTWYEHSSAGYARLDPATPPEDPDQAAKWTLMPWEVKAEGERLITRQEIDWPFQLGPIKAVPYALGELGHWGQDVDGDDLQRAYGQLGVRASMPMWSINPGAESQLLNVHGLAHKINFETEFLWAEANRDLDELPLYDTINDNSIEAQLNRMPFYTFGVPAGGPVPAWPIPKQFDPRYYALRTNLAGWVTSPSAEIADDMTIFRLGAEQRWQTKRGRPGARRIIDWVTLDTHLSLFPDPDRDNFGEVAGLLDYNFRWHVGDRLTLVSDGLFDFFDEGQKAFSVGAFLTRPPRGSLYLGMHVLEGPSDFHVLSLSYNYRMSPKWVSTFGMSVDLGGKGNIGQNFSITRIGESLIVSAGFKVDAARDNVGVNLMIEPRFIPTSTLTRIGGVRIDPAGVRGLE